MVIYGRFDVLASTLMRNARTVCTMLIRNGFRLLFSIQRKHEGDMKRKSKRNHQLGVCVCVCMRACIRTILLSSAAYLVALFS